MAINLATLDTNDVFEIMQYGRPVERDMVQEAIIHGELKVDRPRLRQLVTEALINRYYPHSEYEDSYVQEEPYIDNAISRTRTWLVSVLAIIADDDQAVCEHLAQYLSPEFEGNPWIPYWLLFGYIRIGAPNMLDIARKVTEHPAPLVKMVGIAVLAQPASKGEQRKESAQWRQQILDGLNSPDEKVLWATLRALRLVSLQNSSGPIRKRLCEIVERGTTEPATYDAIVALGFIKPDPAATTNPAEEAADSLIRFVEYARRNPLQDGLRVKALQMLGKLKSEKCVPTLLEELIAENPSVAREAACALEATLGAQRAVGKVVEMASQSSQKGQNLVRDYGNALRWMKGQAEVAEELETHMGVGAVASREIARLLLAEIGGAMAFQKLAAVRRSIDQYTEMFNRTEETVRKIFEDSIEKAKFGFRSATGMDLIVFIIGVVLILASSIAALQQQGNLTNWVTPAATGISGVAFILYTLFLSNPRQKIQEAVDHLMQLQIVYMGYVRQLTEADQAYNRLLLEEERIDTEVVGKYATIIKECMGEARYAILELQTQRNPRQRTSIGLSESTPS